MWFAQNRIKFRAPFLWDTAVTTSSKIAFNPGLLIASKSVLKMVKIARTTEIAEKWP